MVYWSLTTEAVPDVVEAADIVDREHFMINSDGVLSFRFSPDYEMPRGSASDANNTNTYKVVVQASDDPTGAGGAIMMGYKKVTVNVTNVDETETITLSARQAQVGVELTATYNDLDNEKPTDTPLTWKWYLVRSEIPGAGATGTDLISRYTPDTGGSLRAEASYTRTDGNAKTVSKTINVRAMPTDTNAAPCSRRGLARRSVDENSPPGTDVGKPVAANDVSGDTLTYTLAGTDGDDYRIDPATGQITVGPRTTLDHEDQRQRQRHGHSHRPGWWRYTGTALGDHNHQRRERSPDDKRGVHQEFAAGVRHGRRDRSTQELPQPRRLTVTPLRTLTKTHLWLGR